MKEIFKPWGKEVWLELNDRYCYKRIYINAGYRTSLQYHNHKIETNYIISGIANITLGDQVQKMQADEFFSVYPGTIHRVEAITDVILQEVSTPDVDDVIRVQDDTGRGDGKLERETAKPAICILAAGYGSRMNELTEYVHKGLLPVDGKAVLSHIIDVVPQNTDIVIAVGYKKETIKEYCSMAHPDRNIQFVDVLDYSSAHTGPGTSLKCCRDLLQRPFYIVTVDSLLNEALPGIDGNWLGMGVVEDLHNYSTIKVDSNNNILFFKNKSPNPYPFAFTGVCAILDHETFWHQLDRFTDGELVAAFYDTAVYKTLKGKVIKWHDTGTWEKYVKIRNEREQIALPKNKEIAYHVGDHFIKFNKDPEIVSNIAVRAKELSHLTPPLTAVSNNFYRYWWQPGETLYQRLGLMYHFMKYCSVNLWKREDVDIVKEVSDFYINKTTSRLNDYLFRKPEFARKIVVDGTVCEELGDRWQDLVPNNILPTKQFHGDLQFDNVLVTPNEIFSYPEPYSFVLLDWRPDFGGSLYGDVYYDLAKLYGGMLINYGEVKRHPELVGACGQENIELRHCASEQLTGIRLWYEDWLRDHDYSLTRVKFLTGLIFLSMCPLHEPPFDDYLYFYGRKILQDVIQ